MTKKNDNKSLFLYTALIFIVAILLIIIAFFGQTNLQKSQPVIEETTAPQQHETGIAERASVLSDENRILLEEKNKLESQLEESGKRNEELEAENIKLKKDIEINNLLMSANGYMQVGNNDKAKEILTSVNYDTLTQDQKYIYDYVNSNLE